MIRYYQVLTGSFSQGTFWTESTIQRPSSALALIHRTTSARPVSSVPLALHQAYHLYAISPLVDAVVFVLAIIIVASARVSNPPFSCSPC